MNKCNVAQQITKMCIHLMHAYAIYVGLTALNVGMNYCLAKQSSIIYRHLLVLIVGINLSLNGYHHCIIDSFVYVRDS